MKKLSVIIVNWNRKELLKQILVDISNQNYKDYEIIIVDNGSTDGAVNVPTELGINCKHIKLHQNYGLSVGRNIGINNSEGEYIFIPDNDLRLPDPNLFSNAVDELDNSEYGIISCYQHRSFEEYNKNSLTLEDFNYSYWFFYGGASFCRRKVFMEVGYYDDFFSYGGEEWDMVFRLLKAKIKFAKNDALAVIHKPHESGRKKDYALLMITNMLIAELRYLPKPDFIFLLIWQSIIVFMRSAKKLNYFHFMRYLYLIIKNFKSQILQKRNPLDNSLINNFYAMRTAAKSRQLTSHSMTLFEYYWNKLSEANYKIN